MSNKPANVKKYAFSLYAGAVIFCLCLNLTGSVLNDIMTDYNIDLSNGGLMTFFQYIGSVVSVLILSKIADLFKKPVLLIGAFAIAAIALFFMGGFQPFALFMVLYLVFGAALGIIDTLNNATLTDLYPNNMNFALSILHAACGVGAGIIPIISAVAGTSNWKSIYQWIALVIAVIFVFQIAMYKYDKKSIDRIYANPPENTVKVSSKEFISDKNVWFAAMSMFFYGLTQSGITTWGIKYSSETFPEAGALGWAFVITIFWIGVTASRLMMGTVPFLKKMHSRTALIIGGIFSAISLLIGILSGNYYVFLICMLIFGLFNGTTIPRIVGLVNGWYPQNTGLSSSLLFIALYIGFGIISIIMGVVAASFGMTAMIMVPVISTLMIGLILIPMKRR